MGTFEFYQSIFQRVPLVGLNSHWQKKWQYSTWYFMILSTFFYYLKHQNKVKFFIELLNPSTLKTSVVIFMTLDSFTVSLTSAASTTSMTSVTSKAFFSQKNCLILMIASCLAPNWPKRMPFCELDHQKSKFLLVSGNFDVRRCWGQPIFLFWKNIDKTQMSPSPECAATFFWTWKSTLVGHLGLWSMSYRVGTPCTGCFNSIWHTLKSKMAN